MSNRTTTVRITRDLRAYLKKEARRARQSLSDYVRRVLREHCEIELKGKTK